jgi:hypothetical protein
MFHKNKGRIAGLAVLATLLLSGLALAQDRDGDRDDGWGYHDQDRDRDAYRDGYRFRGGDAARDWGYRDGSDAARSDVRERKSFNPNPRGRYKHADRGYERYFGDRREYQEQYARAYRDGYARAWDNRDRGWRRW